MLPLELEQEVNVFFRLISPIHVVPKKNDSIGFFEIALGNFAGSLQVPMGISDKDYLSVWTQADQVGLFFQYRLNPPEQRLFNHPYPLRFLKKAEISDYTD
jgi:hypothetical protein